ncbi:unnamed protein product, partial [Effrenium voratum]
SWSENRKMERWKKATWTSTKRMRRRERSRWRLKSTRWQSRSCSLSWWVRIRSSESWLPSLSS